MPHGSSRIPKYRHHKPTGQAVVTLNGKDHYLGLHGTPASKTKYARLISQYAESGQVAAVNPATAENLPLALTFKELVVRFLRHARQDYGPDSQEPFKIALGLRFLLKLYGDQPADEFGPLDLQAVRRAMLEVQTRKVILRDKDGQKVGERVREYRLSRRTVNMRVASIKRMLKWAASNQLIPVRVHEAARTVEGLRRGRDLGRLAKDDRKVLPVSDEVVNRTLPWVNPHVRGMIQLQQLTGMRSGEICQMKAGHLDLGGDIWIYQPPRHKTASRGYRRVVFLGKLAQEVLRPFLEGLKGDECVFSPWRMTEQRRKDLRKARKSKVTPSQQCRRKKNPRKRPGTEYTSASYGHAIARACKRAGVPHWHPHQLRHAVATKLRQEYDLDTARAVLGQQHVVVTEIYAELDMNKALEAMRKHG